MLKKFPEIFHYFSFLFFEEIVYLSRINRFSNLFVFSISFMSAIALLGTPSEVYQNGFIYIFIGISYTLVMPGAAYLYLPVFWNLQVGSFKVLLNIENAFFIYSFLFYVGFLKGLCDFFL